jgi:hypothetical protein
MEVLMAEEQEYDQAELDIAFRTIREEADASGFGRFISDADCKKWALKIVQTIEAYKKGEIL